MTDAKPLRADARRNRDALIAKARELFAAGHFDLRFDDFAKLAGVGTGTLYRLTRAFNAAYPAGCPSTAGAAVLATRVKSCRFVYSPTAGATQQSGFVSMQLELERNNETVSLLLGAHVMNAP